MTDALLIATHMSGLLLGFYAGGYLARRRPDLLRWFWGQ